MIGVTIRIEGCDGSLWHVAGDGSYDSPVQLEAGDTGDLFDAPVSTSYQSLAGVAGTRYQGMRYEGREIVLRFVSHDLGSVDRWARVDSAIRRAFSYEGVSHIVVETSTSGQRRLAVRLAEAPSYQGEYLPQYQRAARWHFAVTAEDPFWYGETFTNEFVFDGLNFYGGGVDVYNRGDVATWPKWVLTAPAKFALPDVDLTLENPPNKQLWLPFQPTGHFVTVDTDPVAEMIVDERRALLWAQMNGQLFENPIPAHQRTVTLPVSVDPLPLLGFEIPDAWRRTIANEITAWANRIGRDAALAKSSAEIATEIRSIINRLSPTLRALVPSSVLSGVTVSVLSTAISRSYVSFRSMEGATAQVRVPQRWTRPWGLE